MLIGLFIPKYIDQTHWLCFHFAFLHLFICSVCTEDTVLDLPPSSSSSHSTSKAIFHSKWSSLNLCPLPSVSLSACLSLFFSLFSLTHSSSLSFFQAFCNKNCVWGVCVLDGLFLVWVCEYFYVSLWRGMKVSQSELRPNKVSYRRRLTWTIIPLPVIWPQA